MLVIDAGRQGAFADVSGDHNPLHVDAEFARRSQFGGCAVHGVHLTLAALESLGLTAPTRITSLDAEFRAAVVVGETVRFDSEETEDGGSQISIRVGDHLRARVTVNTAPAESVGSVGAPPSWPTAATEILDFDELVGCRGHEDLAHDTSIFEQLFPSLAQSLLAADAATLLAATRVVGMHCPGRWALLRRIRWELAAEGPDSQDPDSGVSDSARMHYEVASERRRFAMLTLAMSAGDRRLSVETVVRPQPPSQATMATVREHIDSSEFAGTRALIVGGSRGLGEVAAKILAAGSAEVLLTYRTGASDARAVAGQLGPTGSVMQLDIEDLSADAIEQLRDFAPTQVLHFATPPIAKRPADTWDQPTFEQFCRVYVNGLSRLLSVADQSGTLAGVLYPSTVFVEDEPAGFAEYAAAKRRGEELCRAWQSLRPHQNIVVERFPPLVTDQTAARLGADAAANLDVLLPVLRRLAC